MSVSTGAQLQRQLRRITAPVRRLAGAPTQADLALLEATRSITVGISPQDVTPAMAEAAVTAVRAALAAGADVHSRGNGTHTALEMAVAIGCFPVMEELLRAGGRVNAQDAGGTSLLSWSCFRQPQPGVLWWLINAGAELDGRDYKGRTPLHWAVLGGHLESVRTLLAAGADASLRDNHERLAVDCADATQREEMKAVFAAHAAMQAVEDVLYGRQRMWQPASADSS